MRKLIPSLLGVALVLVIGVVALSTMGSGLFAQLLDPSIIPPDLNTATGGETNFTALIRTILNYFLGFLGILCLAIVIYGGFMYVTAGVNDQGAETGKKVLIYAATGVIVILLSFVFVNLLLSSALPGGGAQ